jgi:hypothetical protein
MKAGSVSTESVDYLQRCLLPPADMGGPGTSGAPETRRLLRVLGIGRPDKELKRRPTLCVGPTLAPLRTTSIS